MEATNDPNQAVLTRTVRERVMNVMPAATYQMDRFMQLADLVLSDRCETACVEVGPQPRLHLNEAFVAGHCERDEHLLMLVLHELYHVILGHSRLFKRTSLAHNIAFDALINAMLCHQFREPCYTAFFQELNPWDSLQSRLLRPPPGWPERPEPLPAESSPREHRVHELLYGSRPGAVTFTEILELLEKEAPEPADGSLLLGDHGGPNGDGEKDSRAVSDACVKGILERIVNEWPEEASLGGATGRSLGAHPRDFLLPPPKTPRAEFLAALKRLLDKAGVLLPASTSPHSWQLTDCATGSRTVIPDWRDRSAPARRLLWGRLPLSYATTHPAKRPRWRPRPRCHVYLDVSGSMSNELPWLVGALGPLLKKGKIRLYGFSTVVDEIRQGTLGPGQFSNTGGTDINCVYRHVLGLHQAPAPPRKIVVLTDGYTGYPERDRARRWEDLGIKLLLGITPDGSRGIVHLAEAVEYLPKLG